MQYYSSVNNHINVTVSKQLTESDKLIRTQVKPGK